MLVALSTSVDGQAQSVQTDYTYDVHGRLVKVARPGSTTDYSYDNAQNRISVVTAAGNSAPVAGPDSLSAMAGGALVSINPLLNDTDADSDALTVTGVSASAQSKGQTGYTANSVTYTAYSGQSGSDTFTYTVSDGKSTAIGTVTVTINAAVPVPVANNSTSTVTGNTLNNVLSLNITGGTPTSLAITSPSANGTASVSGTSIRFSPTQLFSGQTSFKYTATNAGGTSPEATVTVNVKPVVNAISGTATTGVEANLALYPSTTYTSASLYSSPSYGTAYISGGKVYYTPNPGTAGLTDTFAYQATSAGVTSAPANISFNIIQGNRPPTANDEIVETYQGLTSTLYPLGNDSDPDGDALTLQSVGSLEFVYGNNGTPSDLGTLTKTGNTVSYRAPAVCNCAARSKYHVIRFSYTVVDSKGATSTAKHAINVYSNQPPVANPATTDPVWQNSTINIDPRTNDTDGDGDALTIKSIDNFYFAYGRINGVDLTSAPADFGSVTNNGTYLTYRAPFITNSGATGTSFIVAVVWYTVSDGRGGTSQSYQIFNVYGPN